MNFNEYIAKIIPYTVLGVIFLACFILLYLGQLELAIRGFLAVGIPALIASILVIHFPQSAFTEPVQANEDKSKLNFTHTNLLFLLIYMILLILLILNLRESFLFFSLIAISAGLILSEIVTSNYIIFLYKYLLLLKIILLFLILSIGYSLQTPMVIFTTDILGHMGYAQLIIENGFINEIGYYKYFPLLHIFNAIGSLLLGINIKTSYLLVVTLTFSISIILVYLISYKATHNVKYALLSALIYLFLRPVVYEGMSTITRTIAYLFCLYILFLIFKNGIDIRIKLLTIFFILPLILVHQTTLVYFTVIILLLFIIDRMINIDKTYTISHFYILLFVSLFISYWFYICGPLISNWLKIIFLSREFVAIDTDIEAVYPSILSTVVGQADIMFIIFLTLVGSFGQLKQNNESDHQRYILAFGSLVMLPLFIPNISQLLTIALGYRLPLIVSPLIAFSAAAGFLLCFGEFKCKHKPYLCAGMIIILMCFFFWSSCLTGKSTDFNVLPDILDKTSSNHFTESELSSFDFYKYHKNKGFIITSDHAASMYFINYRHLSSSTLINFSTFEPLRPNSYILFRIGEYDQIGKLYYTVGYSKERGFSTGIRKVLLKDKYPSPLIFWSNKLNIFNNGRIHMYL